MLAEVGDDRGRFADACGLKAFAGSAHDARIEAQYRCHSPPREEQPARRGRFVWAFAAGREGPARAHYLARREHGDRIAAALRHLFNRMLGQLYRCLLTDQKYDAIKAYPCHGRTPEPAVA
ncbi:hypothetical protein [Rhodococcus koreensis]